MSTNTMPKVDATILALDDGGACFDIFLMVKIPVLAYVFEFC